jgi:hypothetical protein
MKLLQMLQAAKGVQFASLTYRNSQKELARYTILLNASLDNAYDKDIAVVEDALPTLQGIEFEAATLILASLRQSRDKGLGNNDAYTLAGVYADTGVPNVFINTNDGELHIRNVFEENKKVLEEGTPHKPVNSRPLTIAKRKVKKMLNLRSNKIRQFRLDGVTVARVDGDTLVLE